MSKYKIYNCKEKKKPPRFPWDDMKLDTYFKVPAEDFVDKRPGYSPTLPPRLRKKGWRVSNIKQKRTIEKNGKVYNDMHTIRWR